jgi:tripartite-type tricarboxylate transporter receptor subunit TctC
VADHQGGEHQGRIIRFVVQGRNVMKLPRRNFLHLAAGAAALPVLSCIARAQTYPSRPLRWIVGVPPGGGADTVTRIVGQWLSERLGQQVIIENRPGASTNISAQAVINSPSDGYTLLFYGASTLINTIMFPNLPFDVRRDIAPVSGLVVYPMVSRIHRSLPKPSPS